MSLRKASPGEGGAKRYVHFRYVPTEGGAKPWLAWIAGPCWWGMCHDKGKTKPCVHWLTRGEVGCDFCNPEFPPVMKGYQPLYRDCDGVPVMVICSECSREKVDALKFRERVYVSRGTAATDPVALQPMLGKKDWYESTLTERRVPVDLSECLLRVWKIPALVEWYNRTQRTSDNPLSLTTPVKSDGAEFGPMYAAAARRFVPATGVSESEELVSSVLSAAKARAEQAEKNGKGDHKPKGKRE